MKHHPMVKAYIAAFCKAGGKQWRNRFNPYDLQQRFRFGYREFSFRVQSVSTVFSWDADQIPTTAGRFDVVMISAPDLGQWLACDAEAEKEFAEFLAVVRRTAAAYE